MPLVTRHSFVTVVVLALAALLLFGVFMWSGMYNMSADSPHMKMTYSMIETMRNRSIAVRASKLQLPSDLGDPERVAQGAGNYNAMCTGCHLTPGMADTEMSRGLYPAPPNLSRTPVGAAEAFWVIKHGIKASGMPAWGSSMSDEYIWNMAAFLQELPKLSAAQYQAMVDTSGGHEHGGGETKPHDDAGAPDNHGSDAGAKTPAPSAHPHPAGTPAHDDAPAAAPADAHAGMDMGGSKAPTNASMPGHPPGTPADHHGKGAAAAPEASTAPAADAAKAGDGHNDQH